MRKALLAAGVGGLLVVAGSSQAGLVGIHVEQITVTNSGHDIPAGLHTIRISAQFSDPGDQLIGVIGSLASAPLVWTVTGGTWWNSAIGGDGPPIFEIEDAIPEVGYDSYMTIGMSNGGPEDEMIFAPGTDQADLHGSTVWTGGAGGSLNVGWVVPPTDPGGTMTPQTVAGNSASNRVLLAQMTIEVDDPDELFVEGTMGLLLQAGGIYEIQPVAFSYLPVPAALAVLALGGIALGHGRRRA